MMTSEFHLTQRIIQTLPTTTADDRTFPNPSIDTYIRKGGKRSDYGREGGDWANLYNNAQRAAKEKLHNYSLRHTNIQRTKRTNALKICRDFLFQRF